MKDLYKAEIKNRGFETSIMNGFPGEPWSKAKEVEIELKDKKRGLRLYALDSWKKYSRNCSYPCKLVYLAGVDRGSYWAIRCPATVDSIEQALDYTTPAEAKNAVRAGKNVLRQGDVFIIEKKAGEDNLAGLPESHSFDPETRMLHHGTHAPVRIPFRFKIARGKSVNSSAD